MTQMKNSITIKDHKKVGKEERNSCGEIDVKVSLIILINRIIHLTECSNGQPAKENGHEGLKT